MSQLCRSHKNVSRRWFIYLFITEEYFSPGSKISALVLKNWESFCWYFGLTSAPGSQTSAQVSCFTPRLLYFWSSNRRMTNFIGNLEMISLLQEDQLQAGKTRSLGKRMPLSIYPNVPGPSWCWTWRGQFGAPNLKLSTKATSHSSVISPGLLAAVLHRVLRLNLHPAVPHWSPAFRHSWNVAFEDEASCSTANGSFPYCLRSSSTNKPPLILDQHLPKVLHMLLCHSRSCGGSSIAGEVEDRWHDSPWTKARFCCAWHLLTHLTGSKAASQLIYIWFLGKVEKVNVASLQWWVFFPLFFFFNLTRGK